MMRTTPASPVAYAVVLLTLALAACGGEGETYAPPAPSDPAAADVLVAARAAWDGHEVERALALADSAIARAPRWAPAYAFRGTVLMNLNRFEPADADFARALDLDPHIRGAWFQRGHNAFMQGRYDAALDAYAREKERIETTPAAVGRYYADADRAALPNVLLQIGRAESLAGRPEAARTAYRAALAADSTRAQAWAWLGELDEEAGALDDALAHYRRALVLEPFEMDYRYEVGRLLAQAGRHQDALPLLGGVVRSRPWHAGATYNLGRTLLAGGRTDEARALLARADSLQLLQQEIDQALAAAYQQPDNPHRWAELGALYIRTARYDDAESALGAALQLTPRDAALRNDAANLALARGDTTLALRRYEAVLALEPANADVWLNLGTVHALAGRYDEAREAWETALRHDPALGEARRYLARLPVTR